ncbi:peroxiredoxin, Ohr subfamily [Cohaesibacter sp. ES.047]|uniref:organic hydroperoxide resistance protein n=1 Tax=Cohaesibacter sp. ES.047 TaxID=1798205 RepID=UPI000BB71F3A|nr:organic hydroperoxide resistance protein [Cohaesibacter sp. ES.047]SNY92421.1 peroxiredoxin, Ohr subfamily [Cohaesibacter sp. ES.047]
MEIMYKTSATATGGREGTAKSVDGKLEAVLSTPKELGGDNGPGTNPEQLFAAGYAACFLSALKLVASQAKVKLDDSASVTASVGIGPNPADGGAGFAIDVDLEVQAPGVDEAELKGLVEKAHEVCPYSNATRGNVRVGLSVS